MLRCTIYKNENRAINMDDTKTLEVLERQIWGNICRANASWFGFSPKNCMNILGGC